MHIMKRVLLLVLLVVALVANLATPGFAGKPLQTVRPPTDGPILAPFWFGWYYENSGLTDNPWNDIAYYQACDQNELEFWKPLPKAGPVYLGVGWVGSTYGQVANVPKFLDTSVDIFDEGGNLVHSYTPAEVAPYWTGPHQWDLWWSQYYGDPVDGPAPPPDLFNPKIGAEVYINHLYLPLGPFPEAGWYRIVWVQTQVGSVTDLTPWTEVLRPSHIRPGTDLSEDYEADFWVYVE
jgi:hypothetical protein